MDLKNRNINIKKEKVLIVEDNIEKISYNDLINILSEYIDFTWDNNKKNLGYFCNEEKKFVIAPLQDTNNYGEQENKRIQSKYIQYAKTENADLIGIYPIKEKNKYRFSFVLWPNDIIESVKAKKNAAVKVKLYDIFFSMFNHASSELKQRKMRYQYSCFSDEQFKLHYLKIDSNKLKNESIIEFIEGAKEDLSIYKLQQIITTKGRGTKLQKEFRSNLLKRYNHKCVLCDINIEELLIASHIISVKSILEENISDDEKKKKIKDVENGLLLCSLHDALFDKKLISFNSFGKIEISDSVPKELYQELKISTELKINTELYNKCYMESHFQETKKNIKTKK